MFQTVQESLVDDFLDYTGWRETCPFVTDPLEGYDSLKEERNTRYIGGDSHGHDYEY